MCSQHIPSSLTPLPFTAALTDQSIHLLVYYHFFMTHRFSFQIPPLTALLPLKQWPPSPLFMIKKSPFTLISPLKKRTYLFTEIILSYFNPIPAFLERHHSLSAAPKNLLTLQAQILFLFLLLLDPH